MTRSSSRTRSSLALTLLLLAACPDDASSADTADTSTDTSATDTSTTDTAAPDTSTSADAAPDGDGEACVAEGGSVPVIPDAPSCCAGLAPIGCDAPDRGGACGPPCIGASICANCGDDSCGAGENVCNCPDDCD